MNHDSYPQDYIAGILIGVNSIAVVGASGNDVRPSWFVVKYLIGKGFKVLNWADGGWVYTFTKKPAKTPDDVRRLKLFTSAGDPELEMWAATRKAHVVGSGTMRKGKPSMNKLSV